MKLNLMPSDEYGIRKLLKYEGRQPCILIEWFGQFRDSWNEKVHTGDKGLIHP